MRSFSFFFLFPALLAAVHCFGSIPTACRLELFAYCDNQFPSLFFHPLVHWASDFSEADDVIVLEDGSWWRASERIFHAIPDWKKNDPLCLELVHSWFGDPYYVIENQSDRQRKKIRVTLVKGPMVNGTFSRQVSSIDFIENTITLTDRTRWNMLDAYRFRNWAVGDYVISAKSSFDTAALLNVNLKEEALVNLRKWIYGECYH